jgi:ATP-dependent Clp protease ATP-binding subunit ClpC
VGHDEEGRLTGALRARPHSLVLLDEVEKAHPRVLDVFLQLFDAGRLTDARGRTADARHAVFVMTSNLGAEVPRERLGFAAPTRPKATPADGPGPGAASASPSASADADLRRFFRPELLNRIDEIVAFRALDARDIARVVTREIEELGAAVSRRHGVSLSAEGEAVAFVAQQAVRSGPGAREAQRTVERLVEGPLSSLVLSGKLTRSKAWRLLYDEGGVYLLPDVSPS